MNPLRILFPFKLYHYIVRNLNIRKCNYVFLLVLFFPNILWNFTSWSNNRNYGEGAVKSNHTSLSPFVGIRYHNSKAIDSIVNDQHQTIPSIVNMDLPFWPATLLSLSRSDSLASETLYLMDINEWMHASLELSSMTTK